MPKPIDTTSLIGRRFGRLTVISYSHMEKRSENDRVYYWNVRCDCGTEFKLCRNSLINGKTRSCGCMRAERLRAINKLYREIYCKEQ